MTLEEAKLELERLCAEIRRCDQLYYVESRPDIPDHEYDYLVKRVAQIEKEYPQLITPTSPTQRIGDKLEGKANVVAHKTPMLSIENVYDENELRAFVAAAQKEVEEPLAWVCELKIDGVAASLIYEDRKLTRALTRGDGAYGEEFTANARTIRDIPLILPDDAPEYLEVRGEVYMTNENLARLNALGFQQSREANREFKPYANTRNLTSGTIKQLDPSVCAQRRLRFFAHSTGSDPEVIAENHFEFLEKLRAFGFPTAPLIARKDNFQDALLYAREMQERLHELDFEVDGIVLKVDSFRARRVIGSTSKYPKWIVACKFEKYEAITTIRDISVQVGKSGVVTPVAELTPVEIAGTIVSRASLHNYDEIKRKDVRIGDSVVVEKAGKIIPHVVRVETYLRDPDVPPAPYVFPETCPSCGAPLRQDEDSVFIRCVDPECPAQFRERLAFFASKDAMNIDGIGPAMIEKLTAPRRVDLLEERPQLVRSFADLYRLDARDLTTLDGIKDKSAENLVAAIQGSKTRGPARLLAALSIRGVGAQTAKAIIAKFRSFDALLALESNEPLLAVDGIGDVIAKNVYDFFSSDDGRRIVGELAALGLDMAAPPLDESQTPEKRALDGKTICVSGTLKNYDRSGIKETIERYGGKVVAAVSSKTDWLLLGDKPGQTKVDKARALGVPTLTEEEFEAILASAETQDQRDASEQTQQFLF